ncbi:MAG: hypothetical protein GY799_32580 [Desulfobulbaceae bacterium]|nr:hypothetical protein [Desulfobulbaceae bacterium]
MSKAWKAKTKIHSVDWRGLVQRKKANRRDVVESFLYAFVGELGGYNFTGHSEIMGFFKWADKEFSYICSKWVYNGMWKVKGNPLQELNRWVKI